MNCVWRVNQKSRDLDLAMVQPLPGSDEKSTIRRKKNFISTHERWASLGVQDHVIRCYDLRENDGIPLAFLEWAENGSLKDRIQDGSIYSGTGKKTRSGESSVPGIKGHVTIALTYEM